MSGVKHNRFYIIAKYILCCLLFALASSTAFTQPANDNCTSAEPITISNSGFGTGTFTSSNVNITQATVQTGETFAPAILVAGQNQKSIWFTFTLATTRKIRVTLLQSGSTIQAGDAGFAVFKTATCLPTNANLSTKLTPIATFGNTFHPCVDSGVYLVQVSAKSSANGLLSVQIESDNTGAAYDRPTDAYAFPALTSFTSKIDFAVDCQSLDDASEVCTTLSNYRQYTKSTWHTFKTPTYFDYLSVLLASPTGSFTGGQQVFGYNLYKGDARTTPVPSLVLTDGCDSLKTSGYNPDYKLYKCGDLEANTTYTIQLFYKQSFSQDVRLAIAYGGVMPTKAPEPILSSMAASNKLGVLPASPTGITTTATDYLACNSRHSIHPCGDALPANGILFAGNRYNLSTFYTFTLATPSNINITANSSTCGNPALLLRLYNQDISNNCASLINASLLASALTNTIQECLPAGTYTVQVLGRDTLASVSSFYYASLASSSALCMLSNLGQRVDFSIRVNNANVLNRFSLNVPGAYDKINPVGGVPGAMQNGVLYPALADTFGCSPTVLPDTICSVGYNKAMYRQMLVADSGTLAFGNKNFYFLYKLYKGDADALATQQNKHAYPQRITGLTAISECRNYYSTCQNDKVCVLPGTYTLSTFGGTNYINNQDKPTLQFDAVRTTHFSPATAQNMGSILDSTVSALTSDADYFSCIDNAVPINGYMPCTTGFIATKAIYRQFYLKTAAVVSITSINNGSCFTNGGIKTVFSGKVTDGLAGLQPLGGPWNCFTYSAQPTQCAALPAGWYTVVSYGVGPSYQNPLRHLNQAGYSSYVGLKDQFFITVTSACQAPKYNRPHKAAIDTITNQPFLIDWPARYSVTPYKTLYTNYFNCSVDTPFVTGVTPCNVAYNRTAYYVFTIVKATSLQVSFQGNFASLYYSVYKTDVRNDSALSQKIPVASCLFYNSNAQLCNLQPGTYTLVVYADANSNCRYMNPVLSKPCNEPWYNRPYKAAIDTLTNQPFIIDWVPRTGHTAAYPKTDTTYNLYTEFFDCRTDTPFSTHPVKSCNTSVNRVAYYVFKTLKESYVQINTKGLWGAVYALDVRTDSALLQTANPIQPCLQSNGFIQLCRLPQGVYTLVVFAENSNACSGVTPAIYIDQPGYSRFDRAANAYDFGTVPPDSLWHNGKTGDINPLNTGRAPSNDFFYCTTGASQTDPPDPVCNTRYNPQIYNDTARYLFNAANYTSQSARRNLWYTFVTNQGGTVRVKVNNKTIGKQYQYRFAVYRSNVNGTLPFPTVVSSGQIDSTIAQGLTMVAANYSSIYCYNAPTEVIFYRDPCTNLAERYYILVENTNTYPIDYSGMQPNSQAEVSILIDSVNSIAPLFDHYSQAYNMGNVGTGIFTGATDNFSCATRDATDPVYNSLPGCTKNLWYKFTTAITGTLQIRMMAGNTNYYDYRDIQLFRQVIPGDSTATGLQYMNVTNVYDAGNYWGQTCITPGTYYLLLPGCNRLNENVFPQIKLAEQRGDFCTSPVVAPVSGTGMATATVTVNCHTIGTDYGEFNPLLTCPANTATGTYKSSWFRVDITGMDTLDITAYLNENTTANSSQIKYRMMTGNCGAMQEQSCVQDALTQNTYKCLGPGSYFFQVFTPTTATGTIDLKLVAVPHADTCAPLNNCLANANFQPQFDCTTGDSVRFVNYSTYGNAIQYNWNFGYNGQTSTAVSPSFFYPALATSQTYNVTLTASNTGCGGQGTVTIPVTIPARPNVHLGNDTSLCNGGSIVLNATTYPGSVYQWGTGATTPTITTSATGLNTYWIKVTYNGCIKRDTIKVFINPIIGRNQSSVICGTDSVQLSSFRGYGETYLWNTGATTNNIYASAPGIYYCDVKLNGCIKRDTFNVTAASFSFGNDTAVCIRPGQPFILNAAIPGAINYYWQNGSTASTFSVTAYGQYWVRINFGSCTIRDTINIAGLQPVLRNMAASLCAGQIYTLPSGIIVSTAGIYRDTLRTATGCDSIVTITTLTLKTVTQQSTNAAICQGQSYTLPWGTAVSIAGTYRDTLRSLTDGCDSIIRIVVLTIANPAFTNTAAVICQGQSYMLPSGAVVNGAGIYRDTLHYISGCDSLITTLNLTIKTAQSIVRNPSICAGQNYTLPGGGTVSTPGTYYDTLRYAAGCDSVRFTIHLSIGVADTTTINTAICPGSLYTLPSGTVVTAAGIYRDTLRHIAGCDSVQFTIHLTVRPVAVAAFSASVCAGQSYTLPSGTTVTATGIYSDTLKYVSGCDSLINTITITASIVSNQSAAASICAGQLYTLPSGTVVSSSGIYKDTLRYVTGCDSVISTITLRVNTVTTVSSTAAVCQGQVYTLPWDTTATTAGIYKDTLRSSTGCDSIIRSVMLAVTPRPAMGVNPPLASVCEGDSLQLKAYGGTVYNWIAGSGILSPASAATFIYPPLTGLYKVAIYYPVCNFTDTFQSRVTIDPLPVISLTKSNDITCIQGSAQLTATGGSRYKWSPATAVNNAGASNPIVFPAVTTVYHVQAISAKNCMTEDSIEVKVMKGDAGNGFLVPSAFTPDGDGKNDCFSIRHWGFVTDLRLNVYDRWGLLVFSTTDPSKCWNGTYKGEILAPAAFVYVITANTVCGPVDRKGTVVLIR